MDTIPLPDLNVNLRKTHYIMLNVMLNCWEQCWAAVTQLTTNYIVRGRSKKITNLVFCRLVIYASSDFDFDGHLSQRSLRNTIFLCCAVFARPIITNSSFVCCCGGLLMVLHLTMFHWPFGTLLSGNVNIVKDSTFSCDPFTTCTCFGETASNHS